MLRLYVPVLLLAVTLSISCQPSNTSSDTFPARPISILVPWNAGGGSDTVSRTLAVVLQKQLNQSVNVINRTGGGGVVGHLAIAQARPDGYTLGVITGEITMMHWQGLSDLSLTDYTPLAMLINNPAAITVKADAPWDTLDDLLDTIRGSPGALLASGTARGGTWDLARIGFLEAAGLPESALPWVPTQGAAPALQELIAGGVQVVTVALAEAEPLYKAGEVKILAVMADERSATFPEIPTLPERGIDWRFGGWVTVAAPASLPEDVKATLTQAIEAATNDSLYLAPLQDAGYTLSFLTGTELDAFLESKDRINGALISKTRLAQ